MKLPASFTTVTPLSKFLALFFFIFFIVLGFLLGRFYQQSIEGRQYLQSYKESRL
jgi:hypothetical protein